MNTFFYYGLTTPDYNGRRMINFRLLGFTLIYKRNIVKDSKLDTVLMKIFGEPMY